MKLNTIKLFLLLCSLTIVTATAQTTPTQPSKKTGQDQEKQAIIEAFQLYKNALINQNGAAASTMLTKDAIQIYEYYRQAALAGTREEILQIPLVHQAAILVLRGKIPGDQLINMTGRDVYAIAISSGLIAHKWTESIDVLNIELPNQRTAILTIGVKDQPGTKMLAVKEGSQWKFSIREILMQSNATIEALLAKQNTNPEEYLKSVVESQVGPNSYQQIWNPPAQRVRKPLPNEEVNWVETPE